MLLIPSRNLASNVMGHNLTTMKRLIIISLIVFCISCKNNFKPTIQREFLKSDWIIPDTSLLFIEDSLVFFKFYPYELNLVVNKYSISNDSLIIQPITVPDHIANYKAIFKILELTKTRFTIQFISINKPTLYFKYLPNRKLVFKRDTLTSSNKIIKELEFSSSAGLSRVPTMDVKIDDDSVIYLMNYGGYTRYKGLVQHKLSRNEFDNINRKINLIIKGSLKSNNVVPDASYYQFWLKTKDSLTYEYTGCFHNEDFEQDLPLPYLFEYLYNIEWLMNFEKSNHTLYKNKYLNRFRMNDY